MTRILDFSETVGCGATFMLDSGEPCVLSVARTGVRVRKSRYGFMGPILYDEKNAYLASKTGITQCPSLFHHDNPPFPTEYGSTPAAGVKNTLSSSQVNVLFS
jgi:hypothetical protein